MSEFDIRENNKRPITHIRFEDLERNHCKATVLRKLDHCGHVAIDEDDGDSDHVLIIGKTHAENLIKALEKAIELGWLTDD